MSLYLAIKAVDAGAITSELTVIKPEHRFDAIKQVHAVNCGLLRGASENSEALKALLNSLIDKEEQLQLLCLADSNGMIPLEKAVSIPQCFEITLTFLSIHQLMTAFDKYSKLQRPLWLFIILNPDPLRIFLKQFPFEQRFEILQTQTCDTNAIQSSIYNISSLQTILEELQDPDKLKVIRQFKNMTFSLSNGYGLNYLKAIIDLFPKKNQLEVVKALAIYPTTVLHLALSSVTTFEEILLLYPSEERLDAVLNTFDRKGFSVVHYSLGNRDIALIILRLLPEDHRFCYLHATARYTPVSILDVLIQPPLFNIESVPEFTHSFVPDYLAIRTYPEFSKKIYGFNWKLFKPNPDIDKLMKRLDKCTNLDQLKGYLTEFVQNHDELPLAKKIAQIMTQNNTEDLTIIPSNWFKTNDTIFDQSSGPDL